MVKTFRFLLLAVVTFAELQAFSDNYPLKTGSYKHITFEGIKPTKYFNSEDGQLQIDVSTSSSVLVLPLDKPVVISKIEFEWKSTGELKLKNPDLEKTKQGDDALLRVGILVYGDAPFVPFFAPAWIKAIKEVMKHPTDKMIYQIAGSLQPAGTKWESPYSSSITHQSIASATLTDGWLKAENAFAPTKIAGIWIMSDGDNTGLSFRTSIRKLIME